MYKIMIVDDEKLVRSSIKSKIDWERLPVVLSAEASNGAKALELIKKDPPDILLCDMCMEIMNGIELSRHVREHYPELMIIVISGYDHFEYTHSAIQNRAWEYLLKPVDPADLNSALLGCCSFLKQRKEKKEAAARNKQDQMIKSSRERTAGLNQLIFHYTAWSKKDPYYPPGPLAETSFTFYGVMVLHIENMEGFLSRHFHSHLPEMENTLFSLLSGQETPCWFTYNLDQPWEWILIFGFKAQPSQENLETSMNKALSLLTSAYPVSYAAGFGKAQKEGSGIFLSYCQAVSMAGNTAHATVLKARQYMEENYSKKITLDDISRIFFINKIYFNKIFKRETGKTFLQYLTDLRMEKAHSLIQSKSMTIKEASDMVGYEDCRYFSKLYKKYYGIIPSQDKPRSGEENKEENL